MARSKISLLKTAANGQIWDPDRYNTDQTAVETAVNNSIDDIGDVSTLTTTAKTSTVAAINELNTNKQPLDSDLTAIAGLSTNGIVAKTGSGAASTRTITGTINNITVTNGDGVSGNPTINIGSKVMTDDSTHTLTNKTFDANGTGNSISNIEVADFATGVIDTDLTTVSASDDTIPSAKATKTALDGKANTSHTQAASTITEDTTHRFVTDTEKSAWNAKQNSSTTLSGYGITDAYTKTELGATTTSNGGARKIGLEAISGMTSTDVQGGISELKTQVNQISSGGVADGSIGNAKLDSDTKVGSLATLTTTTKTSAVAAINELNSGKQSTISGAASTITTSNLTASKALISNASGKVAVSTVSDTELGYLSGVTSAIQTQLNAKLASSSYTASDVLSKLLTVDGSGSGLDADQLEGKHGSDYEILIFMGV